jgi:hypothetical protein
MKIFRSAVPKLQAKTFPETTYMALCCIFRYSYLFTLICHVATKQLILNDLECLKCYW